MTNGVVAPHDVYAPLSCRVCTVRNVSVPSARHPERNVRRTGWRVGEARNSSSRLKTSLTGRPTQLAPTPAGLLAAVSRNHGTEVQFLSRAGKSLRNRGMVLPTDAADLTRARHDGRTTYLPADGRLFAVRHADGKAAWPAVDLAALTNWPRAAEWRVVAGRQAVLAYPVSARPTEPLVPLAERMLSSLWPWPSASRLPGVAVALAQAALDCRLPLVWLDPDTGRVLATRDLAVTGPGVGVTAAGNFVAVAAAGRAYLLNSP